MPTVKVLAAVSDSSAKFVDLDIEAWHWGLLVVVLVAMLAVDLLRHRDDKEPTPKSALLESSVWVACGLAFSVVVLVSWGSTAFSEYLSGYVIEKSLSVDNVFVWAIIFSTFAIPLRYQHRVLFWGVLGAIVMRGAMILAGTALIHAFAWMIYVFGLVLIVTAVRLLVIEEEMDLEHNAVIRLSRKYLPFSAEYEGARFFTRVDGRLLGTPLLLVMIVVQTTDALFAFDSIPAIFAITDDSFLIFSSNMFAILGLRSLFFALAAVIAKFRYLKLSLVFVLDRSGSMDGWKMVAARRQI